MNHSVDPELIRKYLAGELDNKAMHALEKQALDDPFLADALDGFAERKPDQRMHLADLSKRLEVRVKGKEERKIIPMINLDRRWLAAAGILLLVMGGLFWMWRSGFRGAQSIAYKSADVADSAITDTLQYYNQEEPMAWGNKAEKLRGISIAPDTGSHIFPGNMAAESKGIAGILRRESDTVALAMAPAPSPVAAAPTFMAEKADRADTIDTKIVDVAIANPKEIMPEKEKESDARYRNLYAAKPIVANRFIRGQVNDGKTGLAGVAVRLEGTTQGVVTGADGFFSLNVPDTAKNVNLVTSYIGFKQQRLSVSPRENHLDITLKEDNSSLSDVVVTGYDKKFSKKPGNIYQPPMPAEGYDSYNEYLSKNTRYPASAAADNVKGRVKVSFRVQPDGSLEDFKIVRRLQPDCDAEALRLIKEGPGWTPASDRTTARVTVEVYFPAKTPR
ncbi:TonB family protein [Chitinophaga pinensis]|uniref:TonB family protein n=1 Tax=Chitinophaga pinensis (strain ATCC 43595 / DSM 2588 / LMG 13176 / NBRC 15968 / NCIMB 11800 / UQM 2034) TaxID=485918 RepID=A0A979GNI1_CHIPD|nr:TonB family protein [Chitinophaga pinensis]ACU58428.1 TonB family protein [Chitinophaga pinensis DSM 2588]